MNKLFETALFTRKALLKILEGMTEEQMFKIPETHRNSVFWNVAHLLVTPQLIVYKLSGLPTNLDKDFVERYQKGSVPTSQISHEDLAFVRDNLVPYFEQIRKDFEGGLFQDYNPYRTSTGIELASVEEALKFSTFHDGIHLGVVLSLKKLV